MSTDFNKRLGRRIRTLRKYTGHTAADFCKTIPLSYSRYIKLEQGIVKMPTVYSIAVIAKGLDLTLAQMLDGIVADPVVKPRTDNVSIEATHA